MSSFAPRKKPFRGAKGDKTAVLFLGGSRVYVPRMHASS